MKDLIAFFLTLGFTFRYLFQITLETDVLFLELLLYFVLLISIDYWKHVRYFPFLAVMSVLVLFNPEAVRLVFIMLLCFFYSTVNIRKLALYNCFAGSILLLIVWYLLSTGVLENEYDEYMSATGMMRRRNTLGMGYNAFSLYVSSLLINLYILLAHKNKLLVTGLLFGLAFLCYKASGSQTSFVGEIILILSFWIYRSRYKNVFFSKKTLKIIPLTLMVGTLCGAWWLDRFMFINLLTSNRLMLSNAFLHNASVADLLFGTPDVMTGGEDGITIDNIYMHLLFEGGIVFCLFFYTLYLKWVKSLDETTLYLVPVVMTSLIIGLAETNFLSVAIIGNSIIWAVMYQGAYRYDHIKTLKPTVS